MHIVLHKPNLTKQFLEKVYVVEGLSTWAIERKYNISRSSVYAALKRHGIAPRSIAQSHVKYARRDCTENKIERAYILGFAIGDLRVRKHNKEKSETISIACGSTKQAQIDLIESLFSLYGGVWIGKPDKRGAVNIEAYVNHSFSFLLPDRRTYEWCACNQKQFLSFLAGFTDAEGSLFITNNQARVAWGNYDKKLLRFIKEQLTVLHIESSNIHSDRLEGYVGNHGYARNKNYHHLQVVKKEMVGEMIKKLKPHVRHKDKLKKLAVLEESLKLRST